MPALPAKRVPATPVPRSWQSPVPRLCKQSRVHIGLIFVAIREAPLELNVFRLLQVDVPLPCLNYD